MEINEKIQINYYECELICKIFLEQEYTVRGIEQRLEMYLSELKSGGWLSEDANRFYKIMDQEVVPAISRAGSAMQAANQTIVNVITVFRQSELEAEL